MKIKFLVVALIFNLAMFGSLETFAFGSYFKSNNFYSQPRRGKRKTVRIIRHRNSGNIRRAVCRDGSISLSKNRRGTCSHHGGVARWLR